MQIQPTIGFISKEFELSYNNSIPMAKGVVGVNKDIVKSGEKKASHYYVTCFGTTAEYLAKYGHKGARVFIREWTVEQKLINEKMYYDFLIQKVNILDKKVED